MNTMNWADLKRFTAEKMLDTCPVTVMVNGEPVFVVGKIDDVILTGDLHPRVRTMLLAQEKRARAGMPQPERVHFVENVVAS